jgi:hypothetical protein
MGKPNRRHAAGIVNFLLPSLQSNLQLHDLAISKSASGHLDR